MAVGMPIEMIAEEDQPRLTTVPMAASSQRENDLGQNEQIAEDRDNAVGSNRAMARGPWKHQQSENRHQLVRPHQTRYSKDKVQLHNQVKD